jgi:hypothetical protein
VPALERLFGIRVVADPAAIDAAVGALPPSSVVLRFAPDDAFAIGVPGARVDDPHAIIEDEHGFVGGWCSIDDIRPHVEWSIPSERSVLAQGSVAGVPAKLWIVDEDRVLLVTAAPYAATLAERLGWSRP